MAYILQEARSMVMWAYVTSLSNIFHGIKGKSLKSGTIEIRGLWLISCNK